MRKLILKWLLGSDAVRWQEMFNIACECHKNSGNMLDNCQYLLDQYKKISGQLIAIMDALKDATDLYYLRRKVLEILTTQEESTSDGGDSE